MAQPRSVWVTVDHLRDAVQAGIAPVREEVAELRRELRALDDKVGRLAQRPVRRWVSQRAASAVEHGVGLALAAGAGAVCTYLLTQL